MGIQKRVKRRVKKSFFMKKMEENRGFYGRIWSKAHFLLKKIGKYSKKGLLKMRTNSKTKLLKGRREGAFVHFPTWRCI